MAETDKKLFIETIGEMPDSGGEYSGVYAGSSFCQDALPEPGEIAEMIHAAKEKNLSFHLATPFLTENGFDRAARLAETLAGLAPGSEVIANDLGFLALIASDFDALVPVAGRALAYQRTDPQVPEILESAFSGVELEKKRAAFGHVSANSELFAKFLKSLRVGRMEIQNPTQGVFLKDRGIRFSLHVPYIFVACTRFCPPAESYTCRGRVPGVYECGHECDERWFRIRPCGADLNFILRGNTVYYENPPGPTPPGVDRIVVHRRPS